MNTLLLLRHAKSSRDDAGLDDRDRPLSGLGKRAATAMGKLIAEKGLVPDLVLCSPARRAHDTWLLAARELPGKVRAKVVESLYDFSDGSRLLEVIRKQGGASPSLMLVGHNPSMELLAGRLIGSGDPGLRSRLASKFPTGALAVLRFEAENWATIAEGGGQLTHFIRPKDVLPADQD